MMHCTLEQYLLSIEAASEGLPKLLDEWSTLDDDLQGEYVEHLRWLLDARTEALQMARDTGRYAEVARRIEAAYHRMHESVAVIDRETLEPVECSPNGLPLACHRFDGWSFECEDGDHRDYMFPIMVEFTGQAPEDALTCEYQPERHALIYSDGFVALTLYEHRYFLWRVSNGDPIRGQESYRVSQASLEILRTRCPPKKPWGLTR